MARPRQKTLVDRLADAGEEAIQRLGGAPGADRVLGALNAMRERVDEMQKKMRGFDEIEKRLAAVERRLDKLEGKSTPARASSSSSRSRSSSSSQTRKSSS